MESRHLTFSIRNFKFELPFFKHLHKLKNGYWQVVTFIIGLRKASLKKKFLTQNGMGTHGNRRGPPGGTVSKSDCQS